MIANKKLIEETIALRELKNDYVREFSVRKKTSPIEQWEEFNKFSKDTFKEIYNKPIDGVKLKFRYTTLTINGRHSSK